MTDITIETEVKTNSNVQQSVINRQAAFMTCSRQRHHSIRTNNKRQTERLGIKRQTAAHAHRQLELGEKKG